MTDRKSKDVFETALDDDRDAGWGPVGGAMLGMFAGPIVAHIARRRAIVKRVDDMIKKRGMNVTKEQREKMYLDADNRAYAKEGGASAPRSSALKGAVAGGAIGTPIEYYSKRRKRK